ncbi:MAG: hypothetical protein ABIR84_13215 [Candidatus Nitrotoga sp.]
MQNVRPHDGVNALSSPRRLPPCPVGNHVDAAAESVLARSSFRRRIAPALDRLSQT